MVHTLVKFKHFKVFQGQFPGHWELRSYIFNYIGVLSIFVYIEK